MIVYKTPTSVTFHNRKQFHASQKTHNESTSDWFRRLQNVIAKCEFEHISDYMLIDKFVSGLNEIDFQKISQIGAWTIEELILVVLGNAHIFKNLPIRDGEEVNDNCNISTVDVKTECVVLEDITRDDEINHDFEDETNDLESLDCCKIENESQNTNKNKPKIRKRSYRENSERSKKHIEMLKRTGRYDDYKRRKAENAKHRRMKAKQNEQYLPPELQLHLINERRRATRERVRRWRDRKKPEQDQDEMSQTEIATVMVNGDIEATVPEVAGDELIEEDNLLLQPMKPRCSERNVQYKKLKTVKRKSTYVKKYREFECYLCLLKCKRMYELKAHLNVFHPVEKREVFNCPQCTKTTISREVLSRHLKKHHGTIQMHKCPCCDEQFTRRGHLSAHLTVHPDYRPFICESCGKAFKTINELNSHFRKHTGEKKFKCEVCDLSLVSRSSYRSHMLVHSGEKPYPCKLCHKYFRQQSSLRKHLISIHNQGEKPHLCTTCNKRFSSIYHLRIHLNVHTGARPYRCNYCDSTFSQPSALKAHVERIHENKRRIQKPTQQIFKQNCIESKINIVKE